MQALRVVMLLVTVAVVYLMFVHSQAKVDPAATDPAVSAATTRGQYKEAMDRAHAAAKAMQDERKEADAD